uniref:Uncharacterized protein n=1 Tax=Sphaerodactylus townsendi TaxID=933632 RepID=A0ACB8FWZ2_9SAUR
MGREKWQLHLLILRGPRASPILPRGVKFPRQLGTRRRLSGWHLGEVHRNLHFLGFFFFSVSVRFRFCTNSTMVIVEGQCTKGKRVLSGFHGLRGITSSSYRLDIG